MALPVVLVRKGSKFPPRYVDLFEKLNPVVLSDQSDHPHVPLNYNLPGWWSKLELFSPEFKDHRPCLFMDLDTYVLGDISDMLDFTPDKLWMLRDFYRPKGGQSAIMFIPKETDGIWERFMEKKWEIMQMKGGDQAYLEKFPYEIIQDRFGGIFSYKAHQLQKEPRGRIVCFHGKPKPHECEGWAGEIWRG